MGHHAGQPGQTHCTIYKPSPRLQYVGLITENDFLCGDEDMQAKIGLNAHAQNAIATKSKPTGTVAVDAVQQTF